MPRTQKQIGNLAYEIYSALSRVSWEYAEMKSLGEGIYHHAALEKVSLPAITKLFQAAAYLDHALPIIEPAVVAPVAVPEVVVPMTVAPAAVPVIVEPVAVPMTVAPMAVPGAVVTTKISTSPVVVEPVAVEPVAVEPVAVEPVAVEPVAVVPVESNHAI